MSSGRGLLLAGSVAAVVSVPALAGPQGEQVVHGSASFHRDGARTTITTSQTAIINYQSFNLGSHESVTFVQPGAASRVLNRIDGAAPTFIDGSIRANGSVYFVNPAGVIFGANSVINVGNLFAAAGRISNEDFLSGMNRFTDLSGEVVNHGSITGAEGVHLLGRRVANFGSIVAPDGLITLAAGDGVLIGERTGHVFAKVTERSGGPAGSVENAGTIDAGSGVVNMGAGDHFALALRQGSSVRGSVVRIEGGDASLVTVQGRIDASGIGTGLGAGGTVEITGGTVALRGADIDASGAGGFDGGIVRVGGEVQGTGTLRTAQKTAVDEGSRIDVSATGAGNAGEAIVWSDGATLFRGEIDATAGRGAGGFVEVSGKQWLGFQGDVDVSAEGARGTLLLDPKNILIVDDSVLANEATATNIDDFLDPNVTDGGADLGFADDLASVLTDGQLNSLLALGDVILRAENDILFGGGAAISITGVSSTLDLRALRSIGIDPAGSPASISINLGTGSFIARANYDLADGSVARVTNRDAGDASISFNAGTTITAANAVLQIGDGWDGAQRGGSIIAPNINATGGVLLENLATRSAGGNSILTASGATITANRVVARQTNALNGTIGVDGNPLSVSASFVNVSGQGVTRLSLAGAGTTIDSTSASIAGVSFGTVNGVSSGGSDLFITTAGGLTLSAPVSAAGSALAFTTPLDIEYGVTGATAGGLDFDATAIGQLTFNELRLTSSAAGVRVVNTAGDIFASTFSTGRTLRVSGTTALLSDGGVAGLPIGSLEVVASSGAAGSLALDFTVGDLGSSTGGVVSLTTGQAINVGDTDPGGAVFHISETLFDRIRFDNGALTLRSTTGGVTLNDGPGNEIFATVGARTPTLSLVSDTGVTSVLADATEQLTVGGLFLEGAGLNLSSGLRLSAGTGTLSFIVTGAGTNISLADGSIGGFGLNSATIIDDLTFGTFIAEARNGSVALADTDAVDARNNFSKFAGTTVRLIGQGVSVSGDGDSVLGANVIDLTATGPAGISLSLAPGAVFGAAGQTIRLTTPQTVLLGDGAGADLIIPTALITGNQFVFGDLSVTSTAPAGGGATVALLDGAGTFFTALDGRRVSLTGAEVQLFSLGSGLPLRDLTVSATSGISFLNIPTLGDSVTPGALSFTTAQSIGLGDGTGAGFAITPSTLGSWSFNSLSLNSTGAGVTVANNASGSVFAALASKTLELNAAGAVALRGTTGGGSNSFNPTAGWTVGGALTIENNVTLASSGTLTGGLTVASGAGLTLNGGATLTLNGVDDAAMISLNGGTLVINGTVQVAQASDLTIDITGIAGAELSGSGSINAGGALVRARSAGNLALGSGASADADIDATALGLLSGFAGLAFESTGGSIAVNGDGAFYAALGGGSSLIFDAQTGLSFDATSALALSEDTLVIDALDGGLLRFGTNITGATSGAGGVWIFADAARAERAFSLGATGVNSALVTGSGAFEASDGAGTAFDLTILGDLRAAGLDGTADIAGAVVTVSDGELQSVLGLDAAEAGLALTFDDLVVSSGALVTAPGLLSLSTNAGIGLIFGEGTDTPTTAEIDVAEATLRLGFGSLALAGDSVLVGNDSSGAVFTVIGSGSGLTATSRAGDVTLAGATGATTLSLADLTLGATGGRVVFGADLGSVTATNSATIAGDNGILVTGNAGAFTLDLTGGTLSGAVDASGLDLTLNGTIATAGDLSITADLLDINAALDLNGTHAISLVLGDLAIDPAGSIANYTAFTLDANAGDIFVGEATGAGVNLSTAELGRLTPGAGATFTLLTDGSVFITNDAGNTVLPTVSGLRVAGSVVSAGSGTATLLQLDAVDRSIRIGDGAAADYNITAADIAFFDVGTLEVRTDSSVGVGENAAGTILSILGPNFTVRGSTGANAASLAFDARDRALNIGTSGAGGFELTFADLSRFDADAYSFGTTGAVTLASGIGGDTFNLLSGRSVTLAGSGILGGQNASATITSTAGGDDIAFDLSVVSAGQTSFNANIASLSGQATFASTAVEFQNTTGVTLADVTLNSDATRVASAGTLDITALTTGAGVGTLEFAGSRLTFGTITLGAALGQLTLEGTGALTVGTLGTDTVQTSDLDDFATAGATGLRLESDTSVSIVGNGALAAVFDQFTTAIGAANGTGATGVLTLDNQANALTLGTAQGFAGEFVVSAADFAGVSASEINLRSDANISIADNGAGAIFAALNGSTVRFQGAGGGASAGTGLVRAGATGTLALAAADIATTGGLTLDLDALTTTGGLTLTTGGPIDFSRTTSLNATGVLAITGDLNASGFGLTLAGGAGSSLTVGAVSQLSGAGTYTIASDNLTIASGTDLAIAGATGGAFLRLGGADIQGTLDTGAGGLTIDAGAATLSWGDASGTVAFTAPEAGRLTFSALALLSDAGVVLVNGTGNTDVAGLLNTRNLLVADSATNGAGNTAALTIDLANGSLGLGTGAGDLVLGTAAFDASAANGEFRADVYAFTNATAVDIAGLSAAFFSGRSFTLGTPGNEVDSVSINLDSAGTLALNALNIRTTGEVRFGANVTGLTASALSTIASGPATIVHENDFTYDGTFNLTGNLLASDGVSEFSLTFQNGTTTLAGSGSTTSTVTARNLSLLSAGTLTTQAGNDATLSLAEQLAIDATSTLAVANNRTLTIQSRNAGGIDLGQVAGDGLLIDENELARIALNAGETLTLLTAGDVTLRENAGGALQTLFSSGLTFLAGIDASPVAGISVSSATDAQALTLAPGQWHSASTIVFDSSIATVNAAAASVLRANTGINFNRTASPVTLAGGASLTTLRGDLTFAGAASIDAGPGGFALQAASAPTGGTVTITSAGLTFTSGSTLAAGDNDLVLAFSATPALTVGAGQAITTNQTLAISTEAFLGTIGVFANATGDLLIDSTTISALSAARLSFLAPGLTIDGTASEMNTLLSGAGSIGLVSASTSAGNVDVQIGGSTFTGNIEIGTSTLGGVVISDATFEAFDFAVLRLNTTGDVAFTDTDGANFAHLASDGGRSLRITGGGGTGANSISINATGATRSLASGTLAFTAATTIDFGTGIDALNATADLTASQINFNRAAGFTIASGSVLDIDAATTAAAGDLTVNGVARFAATDARLSSAGTLTVGADGAVVSSGTINSLTVAAGDITLAARTTGGTNAIDVGANALIIDGGTNSVAFGETGIPGLEIDPAEVGLLGFGTLGLVTDATAAVGSAGATRLGNLGVLSQFSIAGSTGPRPDLFRFDAGANGLLIGSTTAPAGTSFTFSLTPSLVQANQYDLRSNAVVGLGNAGGALEGLNFLGTTLPVSVSASGGTGPTPVLVLDGGARRIGVGDDAQTLFPGEDFTNALLVTGADLGGAARLVLRSGEGVFLANSADGTLFDALNAVQLDFGAANGAGPLARLGVDGQNAAILIGTAPNTTGFFQLDATELANFAGATSLDLRSDTAVRLGNDASNSLLSILSGVNLSIASSGGLSTVPLLTLDANTADLAIGEGSSGSGVFGFSTASVAGFATESLVLLSDAGVLIRDNAARNLFTALATRAVSVGEAGRFAGSLTVDTASGSDDFRATTLRLLVSGPSQFGPTVTGLSSTAGALELSGGTFTANTPGEFRPTAGSGISLAATLRAPSGSLGFFGPTTLSGANISAFDSVAFNSPVTLAGTSGVGVSAGRLILFAGGSATTAGTADFTLIAPDILASGSLDLSTGGALRLELLGGSISALDLGAGVNLTGATVSITGSGQINSTGAVTISGPASLGVDIFSGSGISFDNTLTVVAPSVEFATGGDVLLNDLVLDDASVSGATLNITAAQNIQLDNISSTGAGASGANFIATNAITIQGTAAQAGSLAFNAATLNFNALALRVDDLNLAATPNGTALDIDRLTAGRTIFLGADQANALALNQAEIALLNSGGTPLSALRIGTMSTGPVQLANARFNAGNLVLGRADAPVSLSGLSGSIGNPGGALVVNGPLNLADGSALLGAGRAITINGVTTLFGGASIDAGDADLTFAAAIAAGVDNASLGLQAGTGNLVVSDVLNFGSRLAVLDARAATISFAGGVVEASNQFYQASAAGAYILPTGATRTLISLGGAPAITFDAQAPIVMQAGSALNINGAGAVTLPRVIGGANTALTVNTAGQIIANNTLGDIVPLTTVDLTGGAGVLLANVQTNGNQVYATGNPAAFIDLTGQLLAESDDTITLRDPARAAANATILLAGGTSGGQILALAPVTLQGDFTATANNATLSFLAGVNGGANALNLLAPNGTIQLGGTFNAASQTFAASQLAIILDTTLNASAGAGQINFGATPVSGDPALRPSLTLIAGNDLGNSSIAFTSFADLGVLDLRANTLNPTAASPLLRVVDFRYRPFTDALGISAGTPVANTVNIPANFFDNFTPILTDARAPIAHTIGAGAGYNGPIFIDSITLSNPFAFRTAGAVTVGSLFSQNNASVTLAGGAGNTIVTQLASPTGQAFALTVEGAALLGPAGRLPAQGPAEVTVNTAGGSQTYTQGIDAATADLVIATLNTQGGLFNIGGNIGSAARLSALQLFAPGTTLTLNNVSTAGNQLYIANTLNLNNATLSTGVSGALLAVNAGLSGNGALDSQGEVNIAGTVSTSQGQALAITSRGDTTLNGAVNTNGIVSVNALGGTARFNQALAGSGLLQAGGDLVTLAQDANLAGSLTFTAPLAIAQSRSLTAGTINLLGGVLATAGNLPDLTLAATNSITLAGSTGSFASRLGKFSATAPTVALAGSVFAQNGILIDGNTVIAGNDVLLQTFALSPDAGIRITGTVNADNTPGRALTLYVNRADDPVATEANPSGLLPRIELFADVGNTSPLATLNLNFSGQTSASGAEVNSEALPARSFVPIETTILIGNTDAFTNTGALSSVTFNVGTLNIGDREKTFAIGSWFLNATSPNTARLGDITALGDLIVTSPSVVLIARENAQVFDPTNNVFATDSGTDFVAGGRLQMGTITRIVDLVPNATRPRFANPSGDTVVQSSTGGFSIIALGDELANLALRDGNALLSVDVRAEGATNTNIAGALAGANPRDDNEANLDTEGEIDAAVLATLQELGINARPAGEGDTRVGLLNVNLPESPSDTPTVSADRLQSDIVGLVISSYRELFLAEREGEVVNRRLEILATLSDAVDAYFEDTEADDFELDAFITYLTAADSEAVTNARTVIGSLQDLYTLVRLLGLSTRELEGPRNALFGRVRPIDIPRADWDRIIEGQALQLGSADARPTSGQPSASLAPSMGAGDRWSGESLALVLELLASDLLGVTDPQPTRPTRPSGPAGHPAGG